jgi:hypothetical protein
MFHRNPKGGGKTALQELYLSNDSVQGGLMGLKCGSLG